MIKVASGVSGCVATVTDQGLVSQRYFRPVLTVRPVLD